MQRWKAIAFVVLVAGCSGPTIDACGGPQGFGSNGELGAGTFTYACVSSSDPGCSTPVTPSAFGAGQLPVVGKGAAFRLHFTPSAFDGGIVLERAGGDVLTDLSAALFANTEGYEAVLARSSAPPNAVVDLVHVRVLAPALVVFDSESSGTLSLPVNSTHILRAHVEGLDDGGIERSVPLVGLPITWSVSDPNVARIDSDGIEGGVGLVAVGPGRADVTASVGAASNFLHLVVSDWTFDSDGGLDAGADGDADTDADVDGGADAGGN